MKNPYGYLETRSRWRERSYSGEWVRLGGSLDRKAEPPMGKWKKKKEKKKKKKTDCRTALQPTERQQNQPIQLHTQSVYLYRWEKTGDWEGDL